ncbi:chitobiase/beta-hexosaminidase C-terminal domain-containing protein [Aquimarina sp. AU474]|uniref:chitobiase/beta-hexosaminidase C-terminal domain-containing protein n=1 Tax=Aquimarina sp. AU474 TaxID=2108529 RepID=UPI000D68999B|nr:chitobiase/beta-hexosaminidase C-terminal domain-containing protein [Aquimarina sp. AU474]
MKALIILWFAVFFYSCTTNKKGSIVTKSFLQTKEVQLANPKIEVDHMIIDTSSRVVASLGLDNVEIYYTIDGNEPTRKSKKYEETIIVSKPGKYTFKAFHSGFIPSETETVSFYKKGINVDHFSVISSLDKKYPGQGENTLINHQKGSLNFKDGQWIGVTEPIVAVIDFKDMIFLESLDIGYLVNTSAWIFPIEEVFISFSEDGVNFKSIETNQILKELTKDTTKLGNMHISIQKEIRKMRIEITNTKSIPEWHQGKSNPGWLFMDEWIFNTKNN